MLEVLGNFFNCSITALLGFYIIKRITKSEVELFKFKTVSLLLIQIISTVYLQQEQYLGIHTLIICCVNILIYKQIFNLNLNNSIIANILVFALLLIGDVLAYAIINMIFLIKEFREQWIIIIVSNILITIITIAIFNINKLKVKLQEFYINISSKPAISNTIFFLLLILIISIIIYNLCLNIKMNKDILINIGITIILTSLTIIFINNKNEYTKLSNNYDELFIYIQNFEDWIEKEQLNRHEYKNQLAVLRCLTKEKKVKNKIDEILEDNINIEEQAVTNFKSLPKGGIKGLMYYKAAIAQKQKINLTTDVSIENKGILTKLSEKEVRILCKLIGIYFDNAIEAAVESRKKNVTIEIYELKDKVNIVFSNTFKKHKNMKDRNKKGVSSKGEGRGNGLYFASKLIKENACLEEKQEIIDNYYIQELTIHKTIKNNKRKKGI